MTRLFTNFAESTIADVGGIGVDATSFSVQGGHGALFPAPSAGESFKIVAIKSTGEREIMDCTNVTDDTLTVVRAREGTTALVFEENDKVSHRVTAETLEDFMQFPDYNQSVFVNNANGNPNLSDTRFSITPAGVTYSTSESIGPTGSGADHTWTALNTIPADVDWIEVCCYVSKSGNVYDGATNYVEVYIGRDIFAIENYNAADSIVYFRWRNYANIDINIPFLSMHGTKKIPVSSGVFYLQWSGTISGGISLNATLTLTGYGYNS